MSPPVWDWELLNTAGQAVRRPTSPTFATRFDAEAWLGETWRQLAEQGVAAVRLLHDGKPVAPDLPLHSS